MALTSAYQTVADWERYDADKPCILAASAIASPVVGRWNTEGTTGAADQVDPLYPVKRAGDRRTSSWTAPDEDYATGVHTIALLLSLDPGVSLDTFALLNHNLDEVRSEHVLILTLELSGDGSSWTTVLNTSAAPNEWTFETPQRFVSFLLNHAGASGDGVNSRIYAGATWARITVYCLDGFSFADLSTAPHFGEVLLGRRRQLARRPDAPWDDDDTKADASDFVSESGARTRVIRSDGQRIEDCTITFADSAEADVLRAAHKEARRGGLPVLWTPAPSSAPARSFYGFLPTQMPMPFAEDGQTKRAASFAFEETTPYLASEEA